MTFLQYKIPNIKYKSRRFANDSDKKERGFTPHLFACHKLKNGIEYKKGEGFSLVEIIIAVAIFGLFATALIGLIMNSYGSNFQAKERDIAVLYAEEGMEAVWSIRRQAWNLLTNGDHGLANPSNYWEFSGISELIDDKFTRVITIEDACRDGNGDLADCPATTTDLNSKKITVTVTYTAITYVVNTVELINYLTTWQSRDWTQIDWVSGAGQTIWSDITRYESDDGNINSSVAGQVTLATVGGAGSCGIKSWPFTDENNYNLSNILEIEVSGGFAQLVGPTFGNGGWGFNVPSEYTITEPSKITVTGDSAILLGTNFCTGTAELCINLTDPACSIQKECTFIPGGPNVCSTLDPVCSNITTKQECQACGNGCTWSNRDKVCNGTLVCSGADALTCTASGVCTACDFSGGTGSCSGFETACNLLVDPACTAQVGCSWDTVYPNDGPSVTTNIPIIPSVIDSWATFVEAATKNGGEIYYQLSHDGGSNWQYYNGASWVNTGACSGPTWTNCSNIATTVNANIATFDVLDQSLVFRAHLVGDGTQEVTLKNIDVTWNETGGGGGSCSGGAEDCINLTDPACSIQLECTFTPGSPGSCSTNDPVCSNITTKSECNACGNGCTWSNPQKVCNGTLVCSGTDDASCTASGACSACAFFGGSSDICSGTVTACEFLPEASCNTQVGCSWSGASLPTNGPYLDPKVAHTVSQLDQWTAFRETAVKDGGEIYYQLSHDGGSSWQYYNGAIWINTGVCSGPTWTNCSNTAATVNANISTFNTAAKSILFRAYLVSDGSQDVQLDTVSISCSQNFDWTFTPPVDYILSLPAEIEIVDDGSGTNDITQLVNLGGGICSTNDPVCSNMTTKSECNACGNGCTWSNRDKVCNGTLVCSGTDDSSCTSSSDCSACTWNIGGGSSYSVNGPQVEPNISYTTPDIEEWTVFSEVATKNGGEIYYQLSENDGSPWLYFDGTGWISASPCTPPVYANCSTAIQINTGITTFPTTTDQIMFKAYLAGDGSQQVQLDNVKIGWGDTSGGTGFATFGTFTSSAFDTGASSSFNIVVWNDTIPVCTPTCTIQLQVRSALDSGGSPGAWTSWFGASGAGTFFTDKIGTIMPTALNFNQWMQYRVELAGDGLDTPIFQDVSINYTP